MKKIFKLFILILTILSILKISNMDTYAEVSDTVFTNTIPIGDVCEDSLPQNVNEKVYTYTAPADGTVRLEVFSEAINQNSSILAVVYNQQKNESTSVYFGTTSHPQVETRDTIVNAGETIYILIRKYGTYAERFYTIKVKCTPLSNVERENNGNLELANPINEYVIGQLNHYSVNIPKGN